MHKMHNSFSMPQWEECQASGKWENERKSNQTADHLPKCISLMFSIFATTSSPSTPHKTTVYIHLYYILDNPLHFFTTSNFAPINDVPPPTLLTFRTLQFFVFRLRRTRRRWAA